MVLVGRRFSSHHPLQIHADAYLFRGPRGACKKMGRRGFCCYAI